MRPRPRPRSSRPQLSVCVVFEPSRLAARSLADAYGYIIAPVPAHLVRWGWAPVAPVPDTPPAAAGMEVCR